MSPLVASPTEPTYGRMSLLYDVASASTSRTSASPVTSQTSRPRNEVSLATGALSRWAPSRATGS